MMRRLLSVTCLVMLCLPAMVMAQASIKGKVTDASTGEPLPGANVYIQKLNTGAATSVKGTYTISSVPPGTYDVTFTYVGYKTYKTSVDVGNETVTLNAQLQPSNVGLNQVFVTAQGVKKTRNQLSYSAQQVQSQDIERVHPSNITDVFSGKVAGMSVKESSTMGGSTNLVIRGITSLTRNNQPLFVVDGVPFDNSNTNTNDEQRGVGASYDFGNAANDLNPNDIANITVLKGAAATALYGERGANGVIIITTKHGKAGKGVGVTLNAGVGVGLVDWSTFPKYQHEYGAGYGPYYNAQSGDNPYFYDIFDATGNGKANKLVVPFTEDASFGAKFDPNLMVYQWNAFDPTSPHYHQATPWVAAQHGPSYFLKPSVTNNQSFFIDGNTGKGYYKLGYTRKNDTGILPNSNIRKNQLNFGASYDITDELQATGSVNYTKTSALGRYGSGYDAIDPMTNFRQWWEVNVDLKNQKNAYFRTVNSSKYYNLTYGNDTWNWSPTDVGQAPIFWDNQYFVRYQSYENDGRNRYYGYGELKYDPVSWLNIKGRVSADTYDELQQQRIAYNSIDIPMYERYNRSYREYNFNLIANFDKQLTDNLKLSGLLGGNIRKQNINTIDAQTNGGLGIPDIYALSNSKNPLIPPVEHYNRRQVDGAFAEVNFQYRKFLILDLTGRRDVSSTLPKNNNAYFYPSVSAGFVFSELTKKSLPWLSYAKLRASYAEVGHDAPVYILADTYDTHIPFGSAPLNSVANIKNNPNLKPERDKEFEFGLHSEFLQSRAGFDVTYYKTNTIDGIVPAPLSRATGYNAEYINTGNVENRGWEVTAFVRPIETQDFVWTLNVNWSRNRNKVKKLAPGITNLDLADFQQGVSLNATVGQPYGVLRGSNFVYKNGQKVVGSNGYYKSSATSNEIIGNVNPNWTGSLTSTFQYKNLSFSFQIDEQQGGDIFSLDMAYGLATGIYPVTAGLNSRGKPKRDPVSKGGGVLLPGVNESGKPNTVWADASTYANPYGYVRNPNAAFIYSASYLKLREVDLAYSLPQKLVSSLGPVKGINLSVTGRNLWIIHKDIPYSDPEAGYGSGNIQGFQGGVYPTTRNILFNVSLKF